MAVKNFLSMIIPTRNRYERLVRTLKGLASQAARPEELIVVVAIDDPSEADRLSIAFKQSFETFCAVRASTVGAASQRNEGVRQAKGNLIGFCDDDVDF